MADYTCESGAMLKINSIRWLFSKGRQILHEEGFLTLLKRSWFSYSIIPLWENNLEGPVILYRGGNLALRIITCLEEFDRLLSDGVDLSWYEMSVQQCKEKLSKGAILFCALIDRELAHISCADTTRESQGVYAFPVDYRHEVCLGGAVTAPKYRRKGIYTCVYSQIYQYLREKGYSKALFGGMPKDNIAPQKAQAKLGSNIWGEGHHLRLLLLFNFRWVKPYPKSVTPPVP